MTPPETGFAEVNGTRLYYEAAGEGHPLILLHGFGLDRRLWDEQFRDYARRFRVVRYDLRGFGRSAAPDGQPYRHDDDLRALLDQLGIDRAYFVGLSLGGWVALNFAVTHPHRASALVLVGAILNGRGMSAEWDAEVGPIWREARTLGAAASLERWHQLSLFAPARSHPHAGPLLAQMILEGSGWHFLNRDPEQTPAPLHRPLTAVQVPTLVVVGQHDLPDFHAMADELAAIPLARKVTVPGAGHLPPIEAPTLFDALVLGFLGTLTA